MSTSPAISSISPTALLPGDLYDRLVAVRRDLHQHPELSFEEERTARRISEELDRLGIPHRTGVAGHGIVADIPGRADGPIVALRSDMDALPITEETGLAFASRNDGVMHACGHDGHSTILLGAAALLAGGERPPTPVRLIWQPAEERGAGAKAMIAAGVLEGVERIFAGHVDRHYPPGQLAISDGPVNASADAFQFEISGTGGHGARPHETIDAVVVGSLLVMAIQTIVSREVDPAHPSVVSVATFHAGTARNVIAGRAVLEGTIRAQDKEVREHLITSLERIATATATLHGAQIATTITRGHPPVINRPDMAELAREAGRGVVGAANVVGLRTANMGAEDFAWYLEEIPGCYIRIGALTPGRESYPAHSSRFDFHEHALATGAAWYAAVARRAGAALVEGAGDPGGGEG